ncbi:Cohesin subunit rad21-like protein [Elsinoe fawcettii]|nr:Cohesin subunit rad21-like protein [Elsinoe fawcettii]
MFYSETLLQKTGPLAKVWLAANVERKLTKGDCLKTNISKDVRNIVNEDQAPLALRLTSQLLLGVVRIYSRKARYLLDDCNEALIKIKLAFRPGNVDLPSAQSHIANPAAINLPDTLTELDLLASAPDLDELLFGSTAGAALGDQTEFDWGTSQILPQSVEESQSASQAMPLEDLDLGIDLGLDETAPSIEVGRRQETPRRDNTLYEDDLGLDLGLGDTTIEPVIRDDQPLPEDDFTMPEFGLGKRDETPRATERRQRDSESPLSDIGEQQAADLERTFQLEQEYQEEEHDETQVQAAQRAKRRKVLQNDTSTELGNTQIKQQQEDRSKILKQPSFLPRDPLLLSLLNLQKSGGLVSSLLGDGMLRGWAPELRGIMSIEVIRRSGDLKRKRGIAAPASPPAEQGLTPPPVEDMPLDEQPVQEEQQISFDDDGFALPQSPGGPGFDETTIAPVPPAESGPVSLATKHTVHMLRERFSTSGDPNEAPSPGTRKNQSVLFTDLCPERRTTKQDATKLFFETLVLATKDAIKVEQKAEDGVGAPFRIRAKRGLWGQWAEMGVSQTQEDEAQQADAEGMEVDDE